MERERYLDNSFDLVARVRAAREAAQREMEAFGDVSEYEIRKIYGLRTEITYDDIEKTAEEPKPSAHRDSTFTADDRQSADAPESDRRQFEFRFQG